MPPGGEWADTVDRDGFHVRVRTLDSQFPHDPAGIHAAANRLLEIAVPGRGAARTALAVALAERTGGSLRWAASAVLAASTIGTTPHG